MSQKTQGELKTLDGSEFEMTGSKIMYNITDNSIQRKWLSVRHGERLEITNLIPRVFSAFKMVAWRRPWQTAGHVSKILIVFKMAADR